MDAAAQDIDGFRARLAYDGGYLAGILDGSLE